MNTPGAPENGIIKPIRFGRGLIGDSQGIFIIAEAGTSHGGDLERGRRLIDAAKTGGADCIKFQIVYADEILHPRTGPVQLPGGDVDLYERFKSLERGFDFFSSLREYAAKMEIEFLCSPFGLRSLQDLLKLNPPGIKIASPELNHPLLLAGASDSGLPILLSCGVSTLGDIEKALRVTGTENTILLHCVTAYPAPEEEYNLNLIESLGRVFGVHVGISDHSLDPEIVPVLSVCAGAVVIEKHIALSNREQGLDDPIALEPDVFSVMVAAVREAQELPGDTLLARAKKKYGRERVRTIMGTGRKVLAPSEEMNYATTNRSIHALREIRAGEIITTGNVAILRTEKNLRPGLSPCMFESIMGSKALRDIPEGEGVEWADVMGS